MKIQQLSLIILSSLVMVTKATSLTKEDDPLTKLFDDWSKKFSKNYSTDEEKQKRFDIWIDNNGMTYISICNSRQ